MNKHKGTIMKKKPTFCSTCKNHHPHEVENVINLEYFRLDHYDFTGLLPENLCDLNESVFRGSIYGLKSYLTFSYNRLCPPYPSCLRGTYTDGYSGNQIPIIGNQDTSNCGD